MIRIAGAGVSGLAAAIRLAEAGLDVTVYEKRETIGSAAGPHTEGLRNYGPGDALEELKGYGLSLRPFATAEVTFRMSKKFRNRLLGPAYYLITRGSQNDSAESQLLGRALEAGVRLRLRTSVRKEDSDIIATGSSPDRWRLICYGFTFSREGSHLDKGSLYALLDNDIAPQGYFAIAPGPQFHSLYLVSWGDLDTTGVRRKLRLALRLGWVRDILGNSRRIRRISGGAYFSDDPVREAVDPSGALRVGEAAGFLDPIAGYGLRYAIITGALAADAIVGQRDYQSLVTGVFGREFAEANAMRRMLSRASNEDYDGLVQSMGPEMSIEEYRTRRNPPVF